MEQREIDRINELARKSRTAAGLTESEKAEQQLLRRAYIDSVLGNLEEQLEHTSIIDEQGRKRKLKKKKKK